MMVIMMATTTATILVATAEKEKTTPMTMETVVVQTAVETTAILRVPLARRVVTATKLPAEQVQKAPLTAVRGKG